MAEEKKAKKAPKEEAASAKKQAESGEIAGAEKKQAKGEVGVSGEVPEKPAAGKRQAGAGEDGKKQTKPASSKKDGKKDGGENATIMKRKPTKAARRAMPAREAWVDYKPEDVEKLVASLGKSGQDAAEIGMLLREQYAVPSVKAITGKRIERILADADIKSDLPRDLLNLIRKSVVLLNHMKENKKDMTAKRGYQLTVSKIRRLAKYYMRKGRIPHGWRYSPEEAVLLVK